MAKEYFRLLLLLLAVFYTVPKNVLGRHLLDSERDFSRCSKGLVPIAIKNADGFLQLHCVKTKCEDINKHEAVCSGTYTPSCPKGAWVGSVKRQFQGEEEKPIYQTECCVHPIFSRTVAVKPVSEFAPGDDAHDGAEGQADMVDIVTNVGVSKQFDYHSVEITSVYCGKSSTTSTSTRRPTTRKATTKHPTTQRTDKKNNNNNNPTGGAAGEKDNHNNNNNHNNGNPTGGEADNGHNGGGSAGKTGGGSAGKTGGGSAGKKGGGSHPKLEGGAETSYAKQAVPPPAKPPASASDAKAWGVGNNPGGGGAGCFSADTIVQTRNDGPKRMDEIRVGDEVLSSVSWDGNGAVSYQPVTQFIHKDPAVFTRYTVIHTASGKSLSLTPYHLLPQFDCHLLELMTEASVVSPSQYEILFTQSAQFAHRARSGQCVLVVHEDGHQLVPERITNVTSAIRRGVFSPITASGIIVANDVQASCYSSVENHALQHAFFAFVNKVSRAVKPYLDMAANLFTTRSLGVVVVEDDSGQIPNLLRVMWMLSDMVMGSY